MMSEESRRVLDMLAEGKIKADEAEQLLRALGSPVDDRGGTGAASKEKGKKPRFLRIMVEGKVGGGEEGSESANIRVPLSFIKAGIKLGACIPGDKGDRIRDKLKERGIDLDDLRENLGSVEDVMAGLGDMCIEVEGKNKETVRIVCE